MLTTFLAAAIAVITSFMFPVKVVLADAAQSDVIPQGLGEVLSLSLIHISDAKVFRPVKELKGFAKVQLEAGESKTVTIPLDDNCLFYTSRCV